MPRRKAFDKKTATTFSLVYRAQNDPRIHDENASDMVFTEKINPNIEKIKHRQELDDEFENQFRGNEGEAAEYGVYYDDTEYDYMQHLRDMGASSEAHFIEAPVTISKNKGKKKQTMRLEDALNDLDTRNTADTRSLASSRVSSVAEDLLPGDMLPSEFVQYQSYQNQQAIPDDIAGFQPDMDPRLREVLEALEDEAYVDDDEAIFEQLAEGAEELQLSEWEANFQEEEDDGWESDHTIKADAELKEGASDLSQESNDWMHEFNKFKKDASSKSNKAIMGNRPPDQQSTLNTGASDISGLKRKKRKGALAASTGYSMTSSILARTEGQGILDRKFEKLQKVYADDDAEETVSMMSGMTGLSAVSGLTGLSKLSTNSKGITTMRPDFDSIMDDFIGTHSQVGKKTHRVKKLHPQTGLEQLKEIRQGLGPARIKETKS